MKGISLLVASALVLFVSCQTTSGGSSEISTGILQHELSNGIPVLIKQNDTNRVQSLKIVLKNHSYHSTISGLEALTLSLLVRGSENYTFDDIQKAGYEVMYNPFIEVVHAGQASVKKALVEMKVVSIGSKLLFIQNHYNKIKN